jgi:hypothetical protein
MTLPATDKDMIDRQLYSGRQSCRYAALGSTTERLDEIAEILATGLMRLRARQSSHLSAHSGESSLDCAAHQSSHANALKRPGGLE